jgi:hypothetical protein
MPSTSQKANSRLVREREISAMFLLSFISPAVGIRVESLGEDDSTEGFVKVNVDLHSTITAFHVDVR